MTYDYDRRQLMSLAFVSILAPGIRLMPGYCAEHAGKAAFLAPLIALPILFVYILLLSAFLSHRRAGEGLGELILRTNGRVTGSVILGITAAFLVFCSGFILRSGAERFIRTVYPAASPWVFVLTMLVIGTLAALGSKAALVRTAKFFAPAVSAVLVTVLIFTLNDIDKKLILPVNGTAPAGLLRAAVPMLEITSGMLAYTAVLEGGSIKKSGRVRAYSLWLLPVGLLFSLMCLAAVGNYGAAMTARFSHPFFAMVRNVTIFRSIEHIEAIIVALWVLPDFVVFGLMLGASSHLLRLVLGFVPEPHGAKLRDMKNGRWLIPVCAASSFGCAVLIDVFSDRLELFSELIVPLANMGVVLVLIPLSFLVCLIRERSSHT